MQWAVRRKPPPREAVANEVEPAAAVAAVTVAAD